MIKIMLGVTKDGELVSCNAEGHALFAKKGSDIVCSAVTTLLRTTLSVLESNDSIKLETNAPKRGTLSFCIKNKYQEGGEVLFNAESSFLIYARIFLEKGLMTLCNEYPEHVTLHIERDV